ncbi:MAG: DUF1593 domain-containing protein [Candidatus Cyclobacteriaceae bacterium M3_2C_046]
MKFFGLNILVSLLLVSCTASQKLGSESSKTRVIISTDIGGSDPDDFQSMVHFLMYADKFEVEGLISSPPKQGRKEQIEEVLEAYAYDYPVLEGQGDFPTPEKLLQVTKQGATEIQAGDQPDQLSEGAAWIIEKAQEQPNQTLWILVWGSITDVAQAVHHEPSIKKNIRVYSIGSWNTKQDPLSREYLYQSHPDLWWIENNTTFRGMYIGGYQEDDFGNDSFVATHVRDHGAMGDLFWQKKQEIKMTDTSSLLYLMSGDINDPSSESWGGSFVQTGHGAHYYTDNPDDSLREKGRKGAKTINRHRKAFLQDWADRMEWLKRYN